MACDSTQIDERTVSAPVIETFTPAQAGVGEDIVVTGQYLNDVVSATIGGEAVEIVQKVSNTCLTLRITSNARSGRIVLTNSTGEGASTADVSIVYVTPTAQADGLPAEVEMAGKLLISGEHLDAVSAVVFTAKGHTEGHEAEVIARNDREIVVKVPYVEDDDATLSFRYYDGSQTQTVSVAALTVKRFQPVVSTKEFPTVQAGDVMALQGEYLDKVEQVLLGGRECRVTTQTSTLLEFVVPESDDYQDGDNLLTLAISYFGGSEVKTLTSQLRLHVPSVLLWKNKKIYAQARTVEEFTSFFSPQTGVAYANSLWRTQVDPVAYKYQAATCSANNVPAVSQAEYDSVNPYFVITGLSAGTLQVNGPASSKTQLKNIYMSSTNSNDNRVTGANADCYGTPALTFLYLDPSKAEHKALIDEEKSGQLIDINEQNFPIDVEAKTCRGINIGSVKNAVNNTEWAPGVFTTGENKAGTAVDAYILVLYYNYKGMGSNKADNVKRIGLLHIKSVDFLMNGTTTNPSASSITFDVYWQKYDYKH